MMSNDRIRPTATAHFTMPLEEMHGSRKFQSAVWKYLRQRIRRSVSSPQSVISKDLQLVGVGSFFYRIERIQIIALLEIRVASLESLKVCDFI